MIIYADTQSVKIHNIVSKVTCLDNILSASRLGGLKIEENSNDTRNILIKPPNLMYKLEYFFILSYEFNVSFVVY